MIQIAKEKLNIIIKTENGITAAMIAKRVGHDNCVQLLALESDRLAAVSYFKQKGLGPVETKVLEVTEPLVVHKGAI